MIKKSYDVFRVALIGCGNLGSRHLQALKKTQRDIMLTVCEPSENAREVAIERYRQIPDNEHIRKFECIDDYKKLSGEQDLIIVATSAKGRYEITRWILENTCIKYLILEKVVFQKLEHFDIIGEMIQEKNVKVWVNCGYRLFSFYQNLKKEMEKEDKVNLVVSGSNWGMACNSIHMLALYQYITGSKIYQFDNAGLIPELFESKREGYKEFFGQYSIETDRGKILIQCEREGTPQMYISFDSADVSAEIDDTAQMATLFYKDRNQHEQKPVDVEFQSNVTNKLVEALIDTGECGLISYEESAVLHKIMLECFLDHMKKFMKEEVTICPIT